MPSLEGIKSTIIQNGDEMQLPKPFKIKGHLEWDGQRWQQSHYHQTPEKIAWLNDNLGRIPLPAPNLGDQATFLWEHDAPVRGTIRRISLYVDHEIFGEDQWKISFDIDWGGHIRWVTPKSFLGKIWKDYE